MIQRCPHVSDTVAFGDKQCLRPAGHEGGHVLGDLSMDPDNPEKFEAFTIARNARGFAEYAEHVAAGRDDGKSWPHL